MSSSNIIIIVVFFTIPASSSLFQIITKMKNERALGAPVQRRYSLRLTKTKQPSTCDLLLPLRPLLYLCACKQRSQAATTSTAPLNGHSHHHHVKSVVVQVVVSTVTRPSRRTDRSSCLLGRSRPTTADYCTAFDSRTERSQVAYRIP